MTTLISLILTLAIFSYLLDDNPLFRLAISMFVGLAAAFTVSVTFRSVILPLIGSGSGNAILFVTALTFTILLLVKPIRSLRILSNIPLGFLIAVGASISIIGAISGTLIPIVSQTAQIDRDGDLMAIISSIVIIIGVISSLLYFNYSVRENAQGVVERGRIMKLIAGLGQGFIVITLGALYGAAILTSLTILTGQLDMLFGA